jgi:hypothetical protein
LESTQAVVDRLIELTQLVEGFEVEPSKAELREIAGELQGEKVKARKIAQPFLGSKEPHFVGNVFEMMRRPGDRPLWRPSCSYRSNCVPLGVAELEYCDSSNCEVGVIQFSNSKTMGGQAVQEL